jgi:hypothetical protein
MTQFRIFQLCDDGKATDIQKSVIRSLIVSPGGLGCWAFFAYYNFIL